MDISEGRSAADSISESVPVGPKVRDGAGSECPWGMGPACPLVCLSLLSRALRLPEAQRSRKLTCLHAIAMTFASRAVGWGWGFHRDLALSLFPWGPDTLLGWNCSAFLGLLTPGCLTALCSPRVSALCLHQSHGHLYHVWPLRLSHQEGWQVRGGWGWLSQIIVVSVWIYYFGEGPQPARLRAT